MPDYGAMADDYANNPPTAHEILSIEGRPMTDIHITADGISIDGALIPANAISQHVHIPTPDLNTINSITFTVFYDKLVIEPEVGKR